MKMVLFFPDLTRSVPLRRDRMMGRVPTIAIALLLSVAIASVRSELTPPYFNLAEGRKITASATCGVDTDGAELYCKLVGANTENDHLNQYSVIQGQVGFFLNSIFEC